MSKPNRNRPRIAIAVLTSVLLFAAAATHAQFYPIVPPPLAPTNLTPVSGDYEGKTGNLTPLTPSWGQFFSTGLVLNPLATHFVICFDPYVGASPPACNVANADWTETISASSPALTRTGNVFTFSPGRYIADTELDRRMRLTVGACSQLVNQSCRYIGVDLYYSSMNPAMSTTGDSTSTATDWNLDVRATNASASNPQGTRDVPRFNGTVEYWEVLGYGNMGRNCRTDFASPDVANDMTVVAIDEKGGTKLVPSLNLPGVPYTGPAIVGLYRLGGAWDGKSFTTFRDPAILAGTTTAQGIGSAKFPVASAGLQRTFVVLSRLDSGGAVREFNETDNAKAQCKKR